MQGVQLPDAELLAKAMTIDPGRSNIILPTGKKGSGKSEVGHLIFNAWPDDRAVLDITGDARPDDPYSIPVVAPFKPLSHYRGLKRGLARDRGLPWPAPDGDRVTLWIRVTPQQEEKSFHRQQDDALALGLFPQDNRFLFWVDEYGRMVKKGGVAGPNLNLALQSSRHYGPLSLLLPCPRLRWIDPLTIQQTDLALIYKLANADDREILAKNLGIPLADFERAYFDNQARGLHCFLMYHAGLDQLFDCPPLPIAKSHGGRS
jgi:hypothetical protein